MISNDALLEKFVNLSELLARVEHDRELLAELLVMFQEELPGLQDALHDAILVGDLAETAKAAHALKGMFANLSMRRGALLAATIDAAAQARDMPTIRETLGVFDSEIAALSAAVDAFIAGK